MTTYLITGSSRGIGLELATQLASLPSSEASLIFAAARSKPTETLQRLLDSSNGRVKFVKLETTDETSIKEAAAAVEKELGGNGLDVLINNAGIMPMTTGGVENMDNLTTTFTTNVQGVHLVTSAFLPLIRKSSAKLVVNISTTLGSIAKARTYARMPVPAYKITKAALNMLTVQYALEYENEGLSFIALSPGWLQTDLGSAQADLPVNVGVKAVLDIVHHAEKDRDMTGKFFNIHVPGWEEAPGFNQYKGGCSPW